MHIFKVYNLEFQVYSWSCAVLTTVPLQNSLSAQNELHTHWQPLSISLPDPAPPQP
jgi:hypothetical protein